MFHWNGTELHILKLNSSLPRKQEALPWFVSGKISGSGHLLQMLEFQNFQGKERSFIKS